MEKIREGYTRVSTVLGQWNHLSHIDPDVLANKCRIGSNVHEKIAAELDGIYLDLHEDEQPYFDSWSKWNEETSEEVRYLKLEERFYCDAMKLTGCIDAIIQLKDAPGSVHILDYKTSATPNKKMWALQASFYHYLAKESGLEISPFVWFIHLRKNGAKAKVHVFECTEELWEVCLSAFHTYEYFNA